jgi:hypothetical protein
LVQRLFLEFSVLPKIRHDVLQCVYELVLHPVGIAKF